LVFGESECQAGLRVASGAKFRLDLPVVASSHVWRCVEVEGQAPDPPRVESAEQLVFSARGPGRWRFLLREMEWWQEGTSADDCPGIVCRVTVVETDRFAQQCGERIAGLLAACAVSNGPAAPRLRDLQAKFALNSAPRPEQVLADFIDWTRGSAR